MSLEAFLAEVEKVESGGGGGTFITVAKARVYFCFQGWTNNESKLFEFEPNNNEAEAAARVECQAYIDSGQNQYDQWPQKGICTHIFGDNVPTNAEGKFHWGDIEDFVKKYESDINASNLSEDESKLVNGLMPFSLVVEGIKNNDSVADWEVHWVKLSQEIDQWAKAKGKKTKKGYPLRVHVIQHVYKSEAEAKADAEKIKAGQVTSQPQAIVGQLSALALGNWDSENGNNEVALKALMGQKAAIQNFIQNARNGIGVEKKLGAADAQAYAATGHGIEVNDLPLIGIEIVPF